jgi:hypothetical protein
MWQSDPGRDAREIGSALVYAISDDLGNLDLSLLVGALLTKALYLFMGRPARCSALTRVFRETPLFSQTMMLAFAAV